MIAGIISGLWFIRKREREDSFDIFIRQRNMIYVCIMAVTCILAGAASVFAKEIFMNITGRAGFGFGADNFTRFSLTIVLFLYSMVLIYGMEYMKKEHRQEQFFIFFFVSLSAMIAVCFSRNPVTLYCCFEVATLSSMPMVLHEMDKESVRAGVKYLFYSIGGALMGLCGVLAVYTFSRGDASFVMGGFVDRIMISGSQQLFFAMILTGVIGFGTKAGIYPLHGWLPVAHPIAPAPASALLSGIIAKAGVIALVRLVYYSVGTDILKDTPVSDTWMILCMITIIVGSSMALLEKNLKKRLAYSTVSQLSYIMAGLSLMSDSGLKGGLMQMMAHATAKCCCFLAAGAVIYITGIRNVDEMKGIGKRLPVTMICFTLCSLSLIGIPPMGGFIAKWQLSCAALAKGSGIWNAAPVIVLVISALLTGGYLLPVVIDAFFPVIAGNGSDAAFAKQGKAKEMQKNGEPVLMVIPMVILTAAALITGLFGDRILTMLMG